MDMNLLVHLGEPCTQIRVKILRWRPRTGESYPRLLAVDFSVRVRQPPGVEST